MCNWLRMMVGIRETSNGTSALVMWGECCRLAPWHIFRSSDLEMVELFKKYKLAVCDRIYPMLYHWVNLNVVAR
jgi:hypothetical protein